VTIAGRTLHYREAGTGPALLLFHGFPFTCDSWAPQLDGSLPFRVLAPDHQGFGQSQAAGSVATMDALAADGFALLDALEIDRAVIGGLSMGGYVALAAVRRDAGRVRGLVLVDTQVTADDDAGKARRLTTAADVEAKGMSVLVDAMLPKLLSPSSPASLRQSVDAMMRSVSPAAAAAASRGMGERIDSKDVLARYAGPCAVIVGKDDVVTPVEKAKVMADLVTGATLHVVEGAGHLPPLEQPVAFNALVRDFAARL